VRALNFQIVWLFATVLLTSSTLLWAENGPAAPSAQPDLKQIVSRMEAARLLAKETEPFQLTREYRMFHGDEAQPASEVKAEINVVPPHERDYKIIESRGSDRGEKVVRKILDHEAEAEKSSPPPTAVVHDNYDFGFEGEQNFQGARCYILSLHPKRKDPSLIDGRAWVDASTFLIRKVEGVMSKSPSWWVKDVTLTVVFGEIGGVWTQTNTSAIANVRIIGKYTVTGNATNLQPASADAANRPPRKLPTRTRPHAPTAVLYPGVLMTR
jgi:hypothetical protein